MKTITRRGFVQTTAASSALLTLGGAAPQCLLQAAEQGGKNDERVLVVVQLSGGNDGLNTVIPFNDETYRKARPKLAIAKSDVLKIDDNAGWHPELRGFADLLENDQLAIVHGVGYPNPNRSHFESMDIWHTCSRKTTERQFGWLGKHLDAAPTTKSQDVSAMHVGGEKQPLALASRNVRVPSVKSLEEFRLQGGENAMLLKTIKELSAAKRMEASDLLGFVQTSTSTALTASERVEAAGKNYKTDITYPDTDLARKLRLVAQLIDAGLKTRIYYVQLDGFDTHAQQADAHAVLLRQWSGAVSAFTNDVVAHGHGERVLCMSFSEFGRRVGENASGGTDHGAAAPMIFAGSAVKSGIIGKQPSLTDLHDGDLKHHTDFRNVYATVIDRWLGGSSEEILGGKFKKISLLG